MVMDVIDGEINFNMTTQPQTEPYKFIQQLPTIT